MNKLIMSHAKVNSGRGTSIDHSFTLVKSHIRSNVNKYIEYYSTYKQRSQSDHPLYKIINSLVSYYKGDEEQFKRFCKRAVPFITGPYGLVSDSHKGHLFNHFYGKGVSEAYVSVTDDYKLDSTLMHQLPVNVVRHPIRSLEPLYLDGRQLINDNGIAVITVNIPLMMSMFVRYEGTIDEFITTIVVPSMVYSHIDVAIFNRMAGIGFETKAKNPFFTVDVDRRLDTVLEKQLLYIRNGANAMLTGVITNVPTVFVDNLYDIMDNVTIRESSQNAWVRFATSAPFVLFILQNLSEYREEGFRIDIRRYVLKSISNKTLSNGLSRSVKQLLEDDLESILLEL